MALDRFGRSISYLRISLTDHCNLRCVYCMPEDMTFRPNPELMQDDEILLFARLFTSLGFHKIRLTGGEPTVRAGIVNLVREICNIHGVRSLSITTNGILLSDLAGPLAEAGLDRVNIRGWKLLKKLVSRRLRSTQ
jgi:cyclic pyranopterin phosphate synthase